MSDKNQYGNANRKHMNCYDYDAIQDINCLNEQDKDIKRKILDIPPQARYGFLSKNGRKKLEMLNSFINKYENQLNQNQIESFKIVTKNVSYHHSL